MRKLLIGIALGMCALGANASKLAPDISITCNSLPGADIVPSVQFCESRMSIEMNANCTAWWLTESPIWNGGSNVSSGSFSVTSQWTCYQSGGRTGSLVTQTPPYLYSVWATANCEGGSVTSDGQTCGCPASASYWDGAACFNVTPPPQPPAPVGPCSGDLVPDFNGNCRCPGMFGFHFPGSTVCYNPLRADGGDNSVPVQGANNANYITNTQTFQAPSTTPTITVMSSIEPDTNGTTNSYKSTYFDTVTLKDASGNTLYTWTSSHVNPPNCSGASVSIVRQATSGLTKGASYTLSVHVNPYSPYSNMVHLNEVISK